MASNTAGTLGKRVDSGYDVEKLTNQHFSSNGQCFLLASIHAATALKVKATLTSRKVNITDFVVLVVNFRLVFKHLSPPKYRDIQRDLGIYF